MLLMSLSLKCQVNHDTIHKVNVSYLTYAESNKISPNFFQFRPHKYVKFTFKVITDFKSILTKISTNSDIKSNLSEVTESDITATLGYDARIKFYINKKTNLVLRVNYMNQPNYSVGIIIKLKNSKHR